MKFVVLIYQGKTPVPGSNAWDKLSESEKRSIYADYAKLNETQGVTPGLPMGLTDAARTLRVIDGKVQVRNGTYSSEGVAGYFVCEAENLEAVVEIVKTIPAARLGGAIEIRPAEKYW